MTGGHIRAMGAGLCLLWASRATAHDVGLSRSLCRPVDAHEWAADPAFSVAEAAASRLDAVALHTALTRAGTPCVSARAPVEPADEGGVRLQVRFVCEASTDSVAFDLTFGGLETLRLSQRHFAQVFAGAGGHPP